MVEWLFLLDMVRRSEFAKERKEHPKFTATQIRQIVRDHHGQPGERVVIERTIVLPITKKRKPPAPRQDWWNLLY
jgi:hypothetical protein